ncbi:uncharacterized protein LOC129222509 [Uloborus diversus]|uniref:uncharacterized protein LOC129222509 n=1 Tax=Uloborus diversus TaxID=327109 RepID=UPI002409B5D6|nr:uncharacterized protein LOC129222509 [Uloborus diversus]
MHVFDRLAATSPRRLSRRELSTVNIPRSSNDIIGVITTVSGQRRERFSLYLSSQLMYGLAYVNRVQSNIVFEEVKLLAHRLGTFRTSFSEVNINIPVSGGKFTIEEPRYEFYPTFGDLSTSSTPDFSYENFFVPTPRSSIESPPHPSLSLSAEELDRHVVPAEQITLREEGELLRDEEMTWNHVADDVAERPLSQGPSFAEEEPIDTEHLDIPLPDFQADVSAPREEQPEDGEGLPGIAPVPEPQIEPPEPGGDVDVLPPTVSPPPAPQQPRRASVSAVDIALDGQSPPGIRRDPSESSSDFVLQDIIGPVPRTRRRRRRYLIVDTVTQIPTSTMRSNFDAPSIGTLDLVNPRATTAAVLLTQFGSRAALNGTSRFWRQPRTLSEPNDPSPYGAFMMDQQDSALDQVPLQERSDSAIEAERAEASSDMREHAVSGTSGLSKSLIAEVTGAESTLARDATSALTMMEEPSAGIELEEVPLMEFEDAEMAAERTAAEIAVEPAALESVIEDLPREEIPSWVGRAGDICIVSPEKTPPPPSPEEPASPLVERTMQLIKECLDENFPRNRASFRELIEKTTKKRKYVAKLFYMLLELHAGEIIKIVQSEPYDDIIIFPGQNFHTF